MAMLFNQRLNRSEIIQQLPTKGKFRKSVDLFVCVCIGHLAEVIIANRTNKHLANTL